MKLFLIVNEDRFFLSHRKELAVRAAKEGYEVAVVCKDTGQRSDVEALGLRMIELPINPTGENITEELHTFNFLRNLYRRERPDIVHHVGLKNILWGSIAAKLSGVKGVVNAVSGLGTMFNGDNPSPIARIIMYVLRLFTGGKKVITIFQNHEDEALFFKHRVTSPERSVFIKGSGVDLNEYAYMPEDEMSEKIHIMFTARMVREKGTMILIDAAELLRQDYEGRVDFWLCGGLSSNPNAISEEELRARCDGSYIQWLGFRKDVKELLGKAHIVAFPSYYREGVPRSLIEATAIGRPIVTTDSIGCKDTVEDGVNGFLIPVRNSEILAEKLKRLIDDKNLRQQMGQNSRRIAERDFSLENVINKHLQVYEELSR
ncbi:MAG: glycosyltransferase family 4 protein [Bacteroidales bacterium]|nr:glycosyltransferase family 4 protein [Bacteroidales bacterium]